MSTRRNLLATAALAATAGSFSAARAQGKQADFLFVQNAASMSYANGKLTLKGVSPVTVFFSATGPSALPATWRRQRWVPFWSDGKDSFAKDNPNADLSILRGQGARTSSWHAMKARC